MAASLNVGGCLHTRISGVKAVSGTLQRTRQINLRRKTRVDRSGGQKRCFRVASHNKSAETQFGGFYEPFYESEESEQDGRIDVLGLGQAMVDFGATVDDRWLAELGMAKGSRKIISVEERTQILQRLDSCDYNIAAAGSLSNTLMALARLGAAAATSTWTSTSRHHGSGGLRVAMAGLIGADALGSFYSSQMRSSGVEVVAEPVAGANTGTVIVLTTPEDADRTMLSYLGSPVEVPVTPALEAAISRSSILVVEGYLWELPGAAGTIAAAIAAAQRHGCLVAMTAGDAGVVHRHGGEMWAAIEAGIDLMFTNSAEAMALVQCAPAGSAAAAPMDCSKAHCTAAEAAALALGPACSMVCVTDGSAGSVITALGQLHVVPPHWTATPPVDTCGAGDAFAAGLLYGFIRRFDINTMGRVAARAASAVIARHGAAMSEEAAAAVAAALPAAAESMQTFPLSASPPQQQPGAVAIDAAAE